MSEADTIRIGDPMPVIGRATAHGDTSIAVTWAGGEREGQIDLIDLAPVLFTFKLYQPLRDNPRAFNDVHVSDDGSALEWGGGEIDMPATTIERLAEEQMTPADFKGFLKRNKLSYDAASAQLGISRRLVAYYATNRQVPRYIALACAYIDKNSIDPDASPLEKWTISRFYTGDKETFKNTLASLEQFLMSYTPTTIPHGRVVMHSAAPPPQIQPKPKGKRTEKER